LIDLYFNIGESWFNRRQSDIKVERLCV